MEYYIKSKDRPIQDLNFIKKLIDNSSKESKNILFVLKNSECDIKTMNQELEMRADLSLSPVKIKYQLNKNSDDDKTILSSENIQCILGIFSELLTNIVKHSEADFVKINIHYDNGFIEVSVEDNGIGFDVSKTKNKYGSYGLSIIEDILDKDCCKFKISSKPGIGTKAIIRICNPYL
jgi:signal transduction histidine kinase